MNETILAILKTADKRPDFQNIFSTKFLWTDPHISKQMLNCHLDPNTDAANYKHDTINAAVEWMGDTFLAGIDTHEYLYLGCGPGLYTSAMASKGAAVTGVDWSESSLGYGRKFAADNNLDAAYIQGNYLDISLEKKLISFL